MTNEAKKIVLKFDMTTGETHIETYGFSGPACADAVKFIKETLGTTTDFRQKAEWFERNIELGDIRTNLCG